MDVKGKIKNYNKKDDAIRAESYKRNILNTVMENTDNMISFLLCEKNDCSSIIKIEKHIRNTIGDCVNKCKNISW